MDTALWTVQWVLAVVFLAAGLLKTTVSRERLQERMPWVEDFATWLVRVIGATQILGAIGLIVPALTGIAPVLTPLAATGLAVTMVLAAIVHIIRSEAVQVVPNVVLFVLAVFVAWGRFGPYA